VAVTVVIVIVASLTGSRRLDIFRGIRFFLVCLVWFCDSVLCFACLAIALTLGGERRRRARKVTQFGLLVLRVFNLR
jgi:hypothetical protein